MSNVDVVRRVYEHFAAGEIQEIHALLAEDFEWTYYGPDELPWAGTYVGREGVDRFFRIVNDLIEIEHFEPREFIPAGDRVIVLGSSHARVLATGARYETEWANIFTVLDGRICRLLDLYETASVVRALQEHRVMERR
jgi:ketosteroid isomerase-like protein